MKKILIHMDISKHGEYDIFSTPDRELFYQHVQNIRNGDCPNTGNKLWFQAIISEISTGENQLEYLDRNMTSDYINTTYNMVVAPMANIFSADYADMLDKLSEKFSQIKIPVYVIACGVQAGSYDELESLCDSIRESATRFISTIYRTGGEFALRGYFTKEFFDRLGFKSAVVTGCPSLYQMGRNLTVTIPKSRKDKADFKPLFNGDFPKMWEQMKKYPQSEYFDQHIYYNLLYNRSYVDYSEIEYCDVKKMVKKFGLPAVELLAQNKINLFIDMAEWSRYIRKERFDFSFGSRIHGSIMSILSGIPAVIYAADSRTREMAEFFDIPIQLPKNTQKIDVYDLYMNVDYTKFNESFAKNYDNFEHFLIKNGIVSRINENNEFMNREETKVREADESEKYRKLGKILRKKKLQLTVYNKSIETIRRLRR